MSPHFDEIKAHLRANPALKWGFVVYRCTYGDDPSWTRFLRRLDTQTRANLRAHDAEDLYPRVDWAVQQDPAWDGASAAVIKKEFAAWTQQHFPRSDGGPRMFACLLVDRACLDALDAEGVPGEEEFDADGRCWVWMVSRYKGERTTRVGVSYVMPRVWVLLDVRGWSAIWDEGRVVTP
ncbi:hypothetical protein C7974DRAFT_416501 [Boeremia exigua]|uniref:uncharacterized protein n=1 Tax=Boeremia exigua TaxID=749465 RepID=UPI001E8D50BC|nr:uncharacterized protein C7974DRAFT_416501 [Boeremia exigua]KAH6616356.1 hypothetical protein C7974DRAFT_416501 [Boeremia exigua]